jgi:DNA-binding NtrC family response regulator
LLLVDAEPGLLRAYVRVLESAGYAVETAEGGDAAVDLFRGSDFDAILTDIAMPGMDGLALLRAIRSCDADVPVVLATGGPTVESAIAALDHGALRYLVKPIDTGQLLEVMERAVQLGRLAEMKREALELVSQQEQRPSARLELVESFNRALETLFLHYQPIVSWSDRRIFGYEALVRSAEPTMPHPGALFEAAEKLGRVVELGRQIRPSHRRRARALPEPAP